MFRQPLGALIFFIAATAEANRTPFDLTEADSEIVAGFATEYSGMRFGFLFFAEYVNVFIISALMVTLFFGAWNAPIIDRSARRTPAAHVALDPGQLGIGLLILLAAAPLVLTLLFALPFYLDPQHAARLAGAAARLPPVQRRGHRRRCSALAYIGLGLGRRPDLVHAQVVHSSCSSSSGCAARFPRVRIDQLMGFAWKWLLPAALLNLFLTAAAIVVVNEPVRRSDERRPRHGPGPRHGPDPAAVLPAQGDHHVARAARPTSRPSSAAACSSCTTSTARSSARRASSAPRPARSSASTWAAWTPRAASTSTGARPRPTASGARSPRCGGPAARCADAAFARFDRIDTAALDEILERHDYDPKALLAILEETQAEYGYLPVGALKHISRITGAWYAMIYGTATYYRHLRFEPPAVEAPAAGEAHRADRVRVPLRAGRVARLRGRGRAR